MGVEPIRPGGKGLFLWSTAGVVLAATILLGACTGRDTKRPAPPFALTDQQGQVVTLSRLQDRVVVLTFLYSHCPDTCPLYLFKITQALKGVRASLDDVAVVVVTVDPLRDTVDRLQDFTASWPAGWHFLTGPLAQVARSWADYGVYVAKGESAGHHATLQSYPVIHTAKAIVIDREGYIAAELTGDWDVAAMQRELQPLLGGESPNPSVNMREALLGLLRRCGELASAQPGAFIGLTLLIMLPGLALPLYLLRTFLHNGRQPR